PGQTAVTVTLSNGQTITIAANQTSGSINVAAPADDRPHRHVHWSAPRITNANGGNFATVGDRRHTSADHGHRYPRYLDRDPQR
ncbi:immunoglobulin-like domain-containing protein, partial [Pseudomonas urethralis]|uniref:immunoglobulin-like domain-containing protein n=1 Tax=Pseudomonas urethralis TaxID=2740517 RepID=UPI001596C406